MVLDKRKIHEQLQEKCNELHITLSELCVEAKITPQTVHAWKEKDPKTLVTVRVLFDTLKLLKAQKH